MIVPVMVISNLALTQQIYSEETNGAHAHYREPVPLITVEGQLTAFQRLANQKAQRREKTEMAINSNIQIESYYTSNVLTLRGTWCTKRNTDFERRVQLLKTETVVLQLWGLKCKNLFFIN